MSRRHGDHSRRMFNKIFEDYYCTFFLLRVFLKFLIKVLTRQYMCNQQERYICTLFFINHFFHWVFRMEFLTKHNIMVITQGKCRKTYGLWNIGRGEGGILILVRLLCGRLPNSRTYSGYIYMGDPPSQ